MSITYVDLADRLSPEAITLFRQMVDLHLRAAGDRMFFSMKSWGGFSLRFCGDPGTTLADVDEGALSDLATYRLLQVSYEGRDPSYRVGSDGVHFHKYLMQRLGVAMDQVEEQIQRTLLDPAFAKRRSESAHHLNEAFALLWTNREDDQTISEIGDHLRKALMDVTNSVLGNAGKDSEQPAARLRNALPGLTASLAHREAEALRQMVEFTAAVLKLDHRANHVRDEQDKQAATIHWEELRRSAFLTAVCCYEIDRITLSP